MRKKKKKSGSKKTALFIAVALFLVLASIAFMVIYEKVFQANVKVMDDSYLYVTTGSNLDDIIIQLEKKKVVNDTASFRWVAEKKNFHSHIYPGRYRLKDGMSNNALVDLLRSGKQEPLQLTFNTVRTKKELAEKVASYIEADESEIYSLLNSTEMAENYGFNTFTFISMFIPNSYEFYWNTSAEGFVKRMAKEYKKFWNESRIAKAKKMGMTQSEVSTLASIVQAEQLMKVNERPTIAGLYLNRLRDGMPLQSDPTLIFAIGDFTIKRVLNADKNVNSRYNTYRYSGLPPGPINVPEITSIDAVLNAEKNDYYYMCAKADFSGYHNFARTLSQHNAYAAQYRKALSKRRIMR